jgi:hypothetical protein
MRRSKLSKTGIIGSGADMNLGNVFFPCSLVYLYTLSTLSFAQSETRLNSTLLCSILE